MQWIRILFENLRERMGSERYKREEKKALIWDIRPEEGLIHIEILSFSIK